MSMHSTSFDTPARLKTLQVTQISWEATNGSVLCPDAAVAVMSPEEESRLWPTIVAEVANSQSYESALAKIRRWFRASEGMVEAALLLKFTEKDPLVNPACFIEVYRSRPRPAAEEVVPVSEVGTDEATGSSTDIGSGDPDGGENCETDGSERNSKPEGDCVDDMEAVMESDTTEAETELDTDDSTSSHAEYHPANTPTTTTGVLDIYQDGHRQTVLPAPDDPDTPQHVTLRYSDFFGRENVPAGRDGMEEVKLDLSVLRAHIGVLLRLTIRKRSAGGGKRKRNTTAENGGRRAKVG